MKASILAIGTELTSGQILNRNSHSIAKKLSQFGLPCSMHIAVPDQFDLMLKTLQILEQESDFIFVTGGLGPTTDDFTRNVVAAWAKAELFFDENSWQHLSAQLAKRGVPSKEIHRQECFFPNGATVLQNNVGTANGFQLQVRGKYVFVLPGPPPEIEGIWKDFVHTVMLELTKNLDRTLTKKWQTIGKPESDIASLIQPVTASCPFEIGYRVHLPYVEVKLIFQESKKTEAHMWAQKIEDALSSFVILKEEQEAVQLLEQKLQSFQQISILDECTGNAFLEKVMPALRTHLQQGRVQFTQSQSSQHKNLDYDVQILPHAEFQAEIICGNRKMIATAPLKKPEFLARQRQYFAEMAILFWAGAI